MSAEHQAAGSPEPVPHGHVAVWTTGSGRRWSLRLAVREPSAEALREAAQAVLALDRELAEHYRGGGS